jgi:hypothetical protein
MSNNPVPAAATGVPIDKDKASAAFEMLFVAWRRLVTEYQDPATPIERQREIEEVDREWALAHQIIAFPVPLGFMMSQKLDVLTWVAEKAGEKMDPCERLILMGLGALRADIVNFCG